MVYGKIVGMTPASFSMLLYKIKKYIVAETDKFYKGEVWQ